jgi:S-adenosylmethionine:tRNA-ribosyltransferase-isomerase (queuine synthetase)
VVFNENVMYRDQLQGKKQEKENIEYTVLDEIKENEIQKVQKSKNDNNKRRRNLKFLQVLLEYIPG